MKTNLSFDGQLPWCYFTNAPGGINASPQEFTKSSYRNGHKGWRIVGGGEVRDVNKKEIIAYIQQSIAMKLVTVNIYIYRKQ